MNKKELNLLVGANIKREREQAGYTQDQFSERIGLGVKSLSAVERGVVGVSLSTLLRICDELSISSNVLLSAKSRQNDVQSITDRLAVLTPSQFEIVSGTLNNLLKAFQETDK